MSVRVSDIGPELLGNVKASIDFQCDPAGGESARYRANARRLPQARNEPAANCAGYLPHRDGGLSGRRLVRDDRAD
jgi:hypothetical protein